MKAKKIVAAISILVILAAGIWAVIDANTLPRTYEGNVDAYELYKEATGEVEGTAATDMAIAEASATIDIADDIVARNLMDKKYVDGKETDYGTKAVNNVAAVVFDFRGFDTLGESFILLTAIAGSFVILSKSHKKKKKEDEQ